MERVGGVGGAVEDGVTTLDLAKVGGGATSLGRKQRFIGECQQAAIAIACGRDLSGHEHVPLETVRSGALLRE